MELIQGMLLDPQGQALFEASMSPLKPTSSMTPSSGPAISSRPSASGVISGETFRLVLDDGRAQHILIEYVEALSPHASRLLFKSTSLPHSPHPTSNPG